MGCGKKPNVCPQHVIVVLAALPAKLDRDEDAPAARLYLALQRELAPICRFKRGKQRPALADEFGWPVGSKIEALLRQVLDTM